MRVPLLLVATGLVVAAAAQTVAPVAAQAPSFDVVSIKADDPSRMGGAWDPRPEHGTWEGRGVGLEQLVGVAYNIAWGQIEALPKWANEPGHKWVIEAKTSPDVGDDQFRAMMRSMLANRFHLVAHMGTEDRPTRSLEVAKGGPKLTPASGHCVSGVPDPLPEGQHRCGRIYPSHKFPADALSMSNGMTSTYELQGWSVSLADLCAFFGANGLPIVDETGIQGKFDIDLKYEIQIYMVSRGTTTRPPDQTYKLINALQKQLGLKLDESKKQRPVPVLIVDHVEMPTAN